MTDTLDAMRDALRQVQDPETGLDLITMGLIYRLHQAAGHAEVTLTTTTPGCPLAEMLRAGVEAAVLAVPGVASVAVQLSWEPPWTPDRMLTT